MEPEQAVTRQKTLDIMEWITNCKDPALCFDIATLIMEMSMKEFLREKEWMCKECKK